MRLLKLTSIILFISIIALSNSSCSSYISKAEYASLNEKYNQLLTEKDTLTQQTSNLTSQLTTKQTQVDTELSQITSLQNDKTNLQSQLTATNKENQILKTMTIGHLLSDYYIDIREDWNSSHSSSLWYFGVTRQDQVDFAAALGNQSLAKRYWVNYENDYKNLAGEYSYVTANNKLTGVVNLLGISNTDTNIQKIKKILEFIHTYIHYENDLNETFLSPIETMGFRSGDCDDFAILAATLFEAVGIESAVAFFDNGTSGHAAALVQLDSLQPYGCYSYPNLTSTGLTLGKWIIIEPQTTIENQLIDWINQLTIKVAAELD